MCIYHLLHQKCNSNFIQYSKFNTESFCLEAEYSQMNNNDQGQENENTSTKSSKMRSYFAYDP